MNITIFIGNLYGGGAERVVCNIANFLENKGHIVDLLTMSETEKKYDINQNVKNTVLLLNSERKNLIYDSLIRWRRLKSYVLRTEVDCYIVFLPITTILLLLLSKKIKAPIIASERCNPENNNFFIKTILKLLANRATSLVFQTKEICSWYKKYISKPQMYIVPNAVNEDFLMPVYEGEREKRIVSVGRLCQQKNYPLLIKAFSYINKTYSGYTLEIYGDGPLKNDLKSIARNYGVENSTIFHGNVTDVAKRIANSKLFVLTSEFEGMPNSLIEAMALGIPCIATDSAGGGVRDIINGENGFIVPCGDVKSLVKAIELIINDDRLSEKISLNALEIREKLSAGNIYPKWEEIIVDSVNRYKSYIQK